MRWVGPALALLLALSLSLIAGESPWNVTKILYESAFGSLYDFGVTLFYTTPLIFTGLSVAVAFHAGLFNIGAEGQLLMACATAAGIGVLFPNLPPVLAPIIAIVGACFAGAAWGAIVGALKAYRQSHEVIVTILLNFIATGLTTWFVLDVIPNPNSQNPESALVAPQYQNKANDLLMRLFPDSGVNFSLVVAVLAAVVLWLVLKKSRWGFEIKAAGFNPVAAERAGIEVPQRQMQAMALAGMLAAGVALSEIIGSTGQFKIGFSPDYGFIGIAVALLARNNPIGLIFSAFFMASLHKGAAALDLETDTITRDFARIIQALMILGVGLRYWPKLKGWKWKS